MSSTTSEVDIKLLIPDLPCADALLPWLRRIDASRRYTNFGPLVQELEQTLAQDWPTAKAGTQLSPLQVLTMNTGTAPLELAIAAMDLPMAGEVLLPAFTFPATASAVLRNGLQVLFADVASDSWQLTPEMARAAAAQRPLALVIPVAVFGCPLDVDAWDDFVADTGIPVLMDAAAAFGNQAIGHRCHATFSLHATKPFGVGEGGLFVTRDAELAAKVKRLANFGFKQGRVWAAGSNAKMSEYAAAVGLCQWARRNQLESRRASLWTSYRSALAALPGVSLQSGFTGAANVPANVVLRLPIAAEQVLAALLREGIETRRWYYPPLQRHPAFAACPIFVPLNDSVMPVTESLAEYSLGLPWHGFLRTQDLARIQRVLNEILNLLRQRPQAALPYEKLTS